MQYLSDEWINQANAAVSGLEPADQPFAVSYTVTDGPDGDRSYTLDLGEPSVQPGTGAPVGLRMKWDTATAIARSELSAQRAFLDGDMQVEGDPQALVGAPPSMVSAEAALAELRSRTTY